MKETYDLIEICDGNYMFNNDNAISYQLEIKKTDMNYICQNNSTNKLKIFQFSTIDVEHVMQMDVKTRHTIIHFVHEILLNNNDDAVLFNVNNGFEGLSNLKYRGLSRLKLFRRLMSQANQFYNYRTILLTNQHFILDPKSYTGDYIGMIIKTESKDYFNIIKEFNKYSLLNSYRN